MFAMCTQGSETLGNQVLLRGGCVLTVDRKLGDFDRADVFLDGARIAAVGPDVPSRGRTHRRSGSPAPLRPTRVACHARSAIYGD